MKNQLKTDLDRREAEAQVAAAAADKAIKAAEAALQSARADHGTAVAVIVGIRHMRNEIAAAEADKQRQADLAKRVAEARAEDMKQIDQKIDAVKNERVRHREAGNTPGVAVLDERIGQLQKQRREMVAV